MYLLPLRRTTATACQYDHIQATQFVLVMAKAFSDQTLDAVSVDRMTQDLFRYRQPQARVTQTIFTGQQQQVAITAPSGSSKDPLKARRLQQAPAGRKPRTFLPRTFLPWIFLIIKQWLAGLIRRSAWPFPWHDGP